MLAVTLADLLYRARQFLIAILGTGLVFGLALLLSGLANGFTVEINQTVAGFGADTFVMAGSSAGRITAFVAFPQSEVLAVRHDPGVSDAAPLLLVPSLVAQTTKGTSTVVLAGVREGALGAPSPISGHALAGPGQAVVDDRLHVALNSVIAFGHHAFTVVGLVSDRSLLGGVPVVYVPLADAQALAVGGRPIVTAVLATGRPTTVPPGLRPYTTEEVQASSVQQLSGPIKSIKNTQWLMWVVAAVIVAALLYVAALERRRDFAVLKALGSSSAALFGSLLLEAVIVALVASAFAEVASNLLTPIMSQPVDIPGLAYATLPLIAVVVGALASLVALRRATGADPAAAFS
ncbi:MAG TPA: ABC transporter permease [Acidimicrobiales bacterium]|nr:ABC transporter permease [Acidimicrobiales bacterium]